MSKLVRFLTVVLVLAGAVGLSAGSALARGGGHHHGGWHGGYHGGYHGGWRGGYGWRGGFGWGFGYPYYAAPYAPYYGPYYYAPGPYCRVARVRVWRDGRWVVRRVRRCW